MLKKWLVISVILILGALTLWYVVDSKKPSEAQRISETINNYKEKWGLEVTEPAAIELLWSTRGWFGDGESITLLQYANNNHSMLEQGMNQINDVNLDLANSYIQTFIDDTAAMYNKPSDLSDLLKQHPIVASVDDYYYYEKESQSFNYLIALYKSSEQRLYILEWYQ